MKALRPIPAAEARRRLAGAVSPVSGEEVPLDHAAGRVLAATVAAGENVPQFPRSAMDGYAVRAADLAGATDASPARLALVGAVPMGERPDRPVGAGEAMAIPTGGHLPAGADAVVMVEHALVEGSVVSVRQPVTPGRHVIRPGDDLELGATVLTAGRRLRAGDLAALAALGVVRVPVHRRPRVAVLSTGAEICPPAETPPPGKVRDMNQAALGAGAAAAGCKVTFAGIAGDDPDALEQLLRVLGPRHDVVLVSGGSSIGGRDHTGEVLARLAPGGLLFHGVQTRPGRPTLAARTADALVMGIPGVPAAAQVIFEVFVRPVLRAVGGEKDLRSVGIRARLTAPYVSAPDREDYLRVRFVDRGGELWVNTLTGTLAGVVAAHGLVIVSDDDEELEAGAEVEVWPWS